MKSSLFGLLAVLSAVAAAFFFWSFQKQTANEGSLYLILTILFVILTVGFGALFMFKRVNTHEDIHITE